MRKGKLTPIELKNLIFDTLQSRRSEVKLNAGPGEDCAVIKCEDYILFTGDPITASCEHPGKLAININANDIAAGGGEPVAVLMTVLAPPNADPEEIKALMIEAEQAAKEINVDIIGGHTEFTDAVTRMVVSCAMIGRAVKPITSSKASAGDRVVISKYAGIEGSLILSEHAPDIATDYKEELEWMKNNLSVILEGKIAAIAGVSTLHDVTEGGILGAVAEVCESSGKGADIYVDDIPLLNATKVLTEKFKIDPYRLLSSGCMLMTTSDPELLIAYFKAEGIKATIIGKINETSGVKAHYGDNVIDVSVEADEIFKV
jgi:hydrogenase expression/formation protein HypE